MNQASLRMKFWLASALIAALLPLAHGQWPRPPRADSGLWNNPSRTVITGFRPVIAERTPAHEHPTNELPRVRTNTIRHDVTRYNNERGRGNNPQSATEAVPHTRDRPPAPPPYRQH
ncbi:hypothetical protein QS306_00035 [Paraburkholderia bonniea]|uniref:hypothetical protein n=1 Tax=Paraburkholderia bonniea TaxID=2152891 RepID=UPI001292883D|nr:hypothetical protein [Paraburkholderia bonniea]WJF90124.1 hypothetical protein QS306_00035 [Paraburkholderia bonniea]WJF93438.1 hypothetical protein QS308_00035 [Paraburkholderia bonniea]